VTNVIKVDFRFCLALLALSAEVSPQAARDGGPFDGKLKMASGRDRLIAAWSWRRQRRFGNLLYLTAGLERG